MRLIDDVVLTTAIEKRIDEATNEDFAEGLSEALIEVHFAPTVDAVQVVRCADCRHFILTSDYLSPPYYDCAFQNGMGYIVSPDDYCAWGERKDDV